MLQILKVATTSVLYFLSYLIPVKKNIWVFGSWFGERYSDNTRYLYEYIKENEEFIEVIWITHSNEIREEIIRNGGKAYLINSFMGYWSCSRAKYALLSTGIYDVTWYALGTTKKVQLWHGYPTKKVCFDHIKSSKYNSYLLNSLKKFRDRIFPTSCSTDIAFVSSDYAKKIRMSSFRLKYDQVFVDGTPRADIINGHLSSEYITNLKSKHTNEKIIAYFPTHRGEGEGNLNVIEFLNLVKLNEYLKMNSIIFLMKMHFYHSDTTINQKLSNIIFLEPEIDINFTLPSVDLLITDYSSVFWDFLSLDKPMIFAPFDLDEYLLEDRSFHGDYLSFTPGPKVYNYEQLIKELDKWRDGLDEYKIERANSIRDHHNYIDDLNRKRITDRLKKRARINLN
ncbi:CDP-glycerol glycerophosphotransferase family protein [Alkalicoccobacillus gibsonii]|uniref:CDP-glycerol glycerophosphotransferase family protein n=1 Tax=Alkalicoccobacillus gibsonii TaxID=79881 RepID=UPI001931FC0D|nr:CDP-glycerol glycerophosphotransferase family protein [Alkalicoccobacillus gibsonii]MBM0065897.1 CDP-glycerol glycerophosphotransferase family protein [Alkalicoccobacillus gibsonii]